MLLQIRTEPIQPLEFGMEGLKTSNRGYYIYVTEACNLRCNYCFVDDKHNHNHLFDPVTYEREADKPDMVKKVVDFIVNDPQGTASKYVHFFGGEPLIRARSIDRIVRLLNEGLKEKHPKCSVTYGITTNGTLLSDEACEILKRNDIGVQLSLDGSEEGNDVHRQLMGGNQQGGNVGAGAGEGIALRKAGAFQMVKVENYLKHFGNNARMTLTPGNLSYLMQSIQELHKLGFKSFSVIPNTDSGEWEGHWGEFEKVLSEVFEYAATGEVTVNLVDHALKKMPTYKFMPNTHLCEAGRNVIGISVGGNIWPCHDFLGKYQKTPEAVSDLQIGHIDKGYTLNTEKFAHLECDDEIKSGAGYDCKSCHAVAICERGCPYINYAQHQQVKTVNATYCETTRILGDITLRYMYRHPEKFKVVNDHKTEVRASDIHTEIALKVFEHTAPFGRNPDGKALLPGPGRAKELGLIGSDPPAYSVQGSIQMKPVNGHVNAQEADSVARWDGERGFSSEISRTPVRRETGLSPRQ